MLRKLIGKKRPQQFNQRWQSVISRSFDPSGSDSQIEDYYTARTDPSQNWINNAAGLPYYHQGGNLLFQKITDTDKQFRPNDFVVLQAASSAFRSFQVIDGVVDSATVPTLANGDTVSQGSYHLGRWIEGPDMSAMNGAMPVGSGTGTYGNWRFTSLGGASKAWFTSDPVLDRTLIQVFASGFGGGKLTLYANDTPELNTGWTAGEYARITVFIEDYKGPGGGTIKLNIGGVTVSTSTLPSNPQPFADLTCFHRVASTGTFANKIPDIEIQVEYGTYDTTECNVVGVQIDRADPDTNNGTLAKGRYDNASATSVQVEDFYLVVGDGVNAYSARLSQFNSWFNSNRRTVSGGYGGINIDRGSNFSNLMQGALSSCHNSNRDHSYTSAFRWQDLWDYFRSLHPTLPADWTGYDLYGAQRLDGLVLLYATYLDPNVPDSLVKQPYRSKMISQGGTSYEKSDVMFWDAGLCQAMAVTVFDIPFDGAFSKAGHIRVMSDERMEPRNGSYEVLDDIRTGSTSLGTYTNVNILEEPDGFTVSGFGLVASTAIFHNPGFLADGPFDPSSTATTVGSLRGVPTEAIDNTKFDYLQGEFYSYTYNTPDGGVAGVAPAPKHQIRFSLEPSVDVGHDILYSYVPNDETDYATRTITGVYLGH